MLETILKKYGIAVIALFLAAWIINTPYPFQRGSIDGTINFWFVVMFVMVISGLIVSMFKDFTSKEKLVLAIATPIPCLFITSLLVIKFIEGFFRDGQSIKFFWEPKEKMLINAIFYLATVGLVVVIFFGYRAIRGRQGGSGTLD